MFIIRKEPSSDYVTKTFRLPKEMVEKLDKLAYDNNLSLNKLVIQCLSYAIENLDESEENSLSDK